MYLPTYFLLHRSIKNGLTFYFSTMCTQINCFVIQQSICIATNGSTVILALAAEISGTNGTVYEECQQCNQQIIASYNPR